MRVLRSIHTCTQRILIIPFISQFRFLVCLYLSLFCFFFIIQLLLQNNNGLKIQKIFVAAFHRDYGLHGHGLRWLAFLEIFESSRDHVDSCYTMYAGANLNRRTRK